MKTVLYFKASGQTPSLQKHAGAYRAAKPLGWRIQTVDAVNGVFPDLRRILDFWKPDGLIVDCGGLTKPIPLGAVRGYPTVFLARRPRAGERIFTVCEDMEAMGRRAARELLMLDFHDYAFVGFPSERIWSRGRERAFREAIVLNGKRYHAFTRQVRSGDPLERAGSLRKWLKALPKPCGILAANDNVAEEVINACAAEGLDVPGELAVLGVDNNEAICERTMPRISSIANDFESSGSLAVRILNALFHSPRMAPTNRSFPLLMVVRRESTRARAGVSGEIASLISYIRQHACEGLRAADVIRQMSGSRRLAEMRFRAARGHSILDEIQSVRLEHAKELLAHGSMSVKAVANFCGYASESSFHRLYRKAFGHPPGETRGNVIAAASPGART